MGLPIWDAESRRRIEAGTLWTEQYGGQFNSPPPEQNNPGRNPGFPLPVRGILLQDVWGMQSGMMQCVERKPQFYTFVVIVGGKNIANPNVASPETLKFRIKVIGVTRTDELQDLFTTAEIDIESTPDQILPKLVVAAQGVNLPVKRTDIQVSLGNPSPESPFTPGPDQPEVDKTADPTETYIGAWSVTFSGLITQQFKGLTAQILVTAPIVQPRQSVLTDVIAYPTADKLTDRIVPVHDVLDRPKDFPWRVGSKVVCLYFPDVGFGIVASTFHDMTSVPN